MSDEIKEILNQLEYFNEEDYKYYSDFKLNRNQIKDLLDYITNLQQENDYLTNELNTCMIERNKYVSRNEKAVGKIESVRIYGLRSGKTLIATLLNEVLNILNGGKDEQ